MTLQVKKTGGSLLPWVVEDDTGSVAWCGSWEDAVSTANEYARAVEVQLVRPDKLFIEHCYSWGVGIYNRDIAQFGDVEASRSMAACSSPRVRLGTLSSPLSTRLVGRQRSCCLRVSGHNGRQ